MNNSEHGAEYPGIPDGPAAHSVMSSYMISWRGEGVSGEGGKLRRPYIVRALHKTLSLWYRKSRNLNWTAKFKTAKTSMNHYDQWFRSWGSKSVWIFLFRAAALAKILCLNTCAAWFSLLLWSINCSVRDDAVRQCGVNVSIYLKKQRMVCKDVDIDCDCDFLVETLSNS